MSCNESCTAATAVPALILLSTLKGTDMRSETNIKLRTGDCVQVKSAAEIADTLDRNGMLDGLPFMPEMLEFCGQHARVGRRAEKTCVEFPGGGYKIREFVNNNTVVLEGLRCSGAHHDGCERGCMIFWKSDWLHKADSDETGKSLAIYETAALRGKMKTMSSPDHYICQSTELAKATKAMTRGRILVKCLADIRSGSRGILEMIRLIAVPAWRKATRKISRPRLVGNLKRTPVGNLGLQPGEWVTVRPASEIAKTLDQRGRNRGLSCDFGMANHSGEKFRVRQRLDRMISEATGEMRRVDATVILEGSNCTCANVVGGCPRQDFVYWREIWLKRIQVDPNLDSELSSSSDPTGEQSPMTQSQSEVHV